jgi:hypothetical protein
MAATGTPPPDFDLDQAIGRMSDAHLHCRDYGHSWRPFAAAYVAAQRAYEQTLRCVRCRTLRHRVLDSHGQVVSSGYTYAEHYLVKGMGRLVGEDRGLIRIASVRADIEKGTSS